MIARMLLVYVLAELAVLAALAATIGAGWTVLLVLGAFAVGLAVAGVQLPRHVRGLLTGWTRLDRAVGDSALVGTGTLLVLLPGLASSVVGVLLLWPPTRAAVRPVLTAVTIGRLTPRAPTAARPDYIDGEVIDVTDVSPGSDTPQGRPPALPTPRTP
ncbi:MAG TPA: FxsA family protein [Mycolicibacillus parakoreensis]|nr:FxsA family protein [Mycolicibacillus parakoreensis]